MKYLLYVLLISLLPMNVYSRALRHIDMNDVKKKHHQKLVEKKIEEEKNKKLLEELTRKNSHLYSNWRSEISEGMTTDGLLSTTLPSTGETTLSTYEYDVTFGPNSNDPDTFAAAGGLTYDTRYYDTVVFDLSPGTGPLVIGFFTVGSSQGTFYSVPSSAGTYAITIPDGYRIPRVAIAWISSGSEGQTTGYGNWRVSDIRFQRRAPMNVFVPLDSPEASSFIRTDPIMANLSPQERLKKLKDMLEASDEYVVKMLGLDFPGTGAVPPGEYDPFKQAPPGEAGDTPGVEIAGTPAMPSYVRDSIMRQYGKPGYGKFTPEDQKNIIQWQQKLKKVDTGTQDTQIAQNWTDDPSTWPSIKNPVKSAPAIIDPKTGWPSVPNVPPSYKGKPGGTKLKLAHYEPEGEFISEKKKLKSPQEVLNKIPGYYDGKPSPLGFPVEPPPKMVNGMHPDLVDGKKVADRFNRLDPESAKAMPPTGNPHIDKKVKAAAKKHK